MRRMGKYGLGVLLLLIGLTLETPAAPANPAEINSTAQPVSYDALVKTVRDLTGKVVIVDFWAEYCSPCKEELQRLLALRKKYGRDGFVLLSVSLDDPRDKETRARIDDFLTHQQADCPNFILEAGWREWQKKLNIAGPPCLYVFDRENCLAQKYTAETDPALIETEIVKHLQRGAADNKVIPSSELLDFRVALLPPDPFSDRNRCGEPRTFQRGEVLTVVINGTPNPGYHTYPVTQRAAGQSPGTLSRWQFAEAPGLRPLWPITESKPEIKEERTKDVLLEFAGPFTWSRDIVVLPDAQPGSTFLSFTIQYTACNDGSCTPGNHHVEIPITITDAAPLALAPALRKRMENREPVPAVVAVPAESEATGSNSVKRSTEKPAPASQPVESGLLGLILTTMAAAVAMLFTPCVFPMIPITVSFFLKQSEKHHRGRFRCCWSTP